MNKDLLLKELDILKTYFEDAIKYLEGEQSGH